MSNPITHIDLKEIGYPEGYLIGIALKINKKRTGFNREEMISYYRNVLATPDTFLEDKTFAPLAHALLNKDMPKDEDEIALLETGKAYQIYGAEGIEPGALQQMDIAMRLPVTVAGALMPDAHQGYGLPIGGVLATKNVVIPYGVGVDIGCRMALTVFDIPESHFEENQAKYKRELVAHTKFGAGNGFQGNEKSDHAVLDRKEFGINSFVKNLQDKAWTQLGSSGGGNHFVEFGIIDFEKRDEILNINSGKYLALLTHSGSRGFGATVADYYTKLAKSLCKLPREAINLAYLDLNTPEGNEYWLAMNLAGDYASACHEIIHNKLVKAIGGEVLAKIENHHNFAWKEIVNGEELIVHRKGATPASAGVMGIIPGSMTASGFLVRGRGELASLNSASHGAGRQMSRTQATKNISRDALKENLKAHQVSLIGAGLDEAPMAYKDIHKVMAAQSSLVDIVGKFSPRIVRMADDGSRED